MYTKYHDPWLSSHPLTGEAMNHIDGLQWANIKNYADAHNHNDRYYTKTEADAKYFTKYFYTSADADLLDGYHASQLIPAGLPIGAIMIWSGSFDTVPTGWHVCDGGTYGGKTTPDMRGRFVPCAGGTYTPNTTGGAASQTPTASLTIADHTLTTDELPSHTHSYTDTYNPNKLNGGILVSHPAYFVYRQSPINEQANGGGAHGHAGSTITFNSIDIRPPYYVVYYIMKYA